MKKRIAAILCLLLTTLVSAVSCDQAPAENGGAAHTHTYTDAFTSNKSHHWHQATCEHGESKKDYAEHADTNSDGRCDLCEYDMEHSHMLSDEWQYNDEYHWRDALCHTDIKEMESLHADNNTDGKCDTCEKHMHIVNLYGACGICGIQVEPVKDGELASVINAILGGKNGVTGGSVKYNYTGINKTDNRTDIDEHIFDFSIGTNGTYTKMTERNTDNQTVITENWLKISGNKVSGVRLVTAAGVAGETEPCTYSANDLLGYYYSISSIAEGYGAEEALAAVFRLSSLDKAENFTLLHNDSENKYSFSFGYLDVNEFDILLRDESGNPTGGTDTVYKVHYYNINVEFSYTDDFRLSDMKIICDCYTDDPGSGDNQSYEADIDLDYDPLTGKCTLRESAGADTYSYTVTQTHGIREEIGLGEADKYIPSDFAFYMDYECTTEIEGALSLNVGQNFFVNIGCPNDGNVDYIIEGMIIEVQDTDGDAVSGFAEIFSGAIFITPTTAGSYTITVRSSGLVKILSVVITEA